MQHGITWRKRIVLSRYGIERTRNRGIAINIGKLVIYIR